MTKLMESQEERKEKLKEIIKQLHTGKDPEELKEQFAELLQHVSPTEISNMEDRLIDEGMQEKEIKRLCDVHVAVFKDTLGEQEKQQTPPGHPIHTFQMENEAINKLSASLGELLAKVKNENNLEKYAADLKDKFEQLKEIDKHYLRKENQLFPILERHDVYGPPKVMWQIHDGVRDMLKEIIKALETGDQKVLFEKSNELLKAIEEMIYKEENILFPMAMDILNEAEWGEVRYGEEEIGYTLVKPGSEWQAPEAQAKPSEKNYPDEAIPLSMGSMTPEQLDLMLTHLPVDLTLVDENDRVRYYSQGKERIFPRSPAIIGRKVQNCHPSDSVHVVNKIVEAFKQGTKENADFWLEMNGKFIYIQYHVLRDKNNNYKGVVEIAQDVTAIRKLEGQKRILDW